MRCTSLASLREAGAAAFAQQALPALPQPCRSSPISNRSRGPAGASGPLYQPLLVPEGGNPRVKGLAGAVAPRAGTGAQPEPLAFGTCPLCTPWPRWEGRRNPRTSRSRAPSCWHRDPTRAVSGGGARSTIGGALHRIWPAIGGRRLGLLGSVPWPAPLAFLRRLLRSVSHFTTQVTVG